MIVVQAKIGSDRIFLMKDMFSATNIIRFESVKNELNQVFTSKNHFKYNYLRINIYMQKKGFERQFTSKYVTINSFCVFYIW